MQAQVSFSPDEIEVVQALRAALRAVNDCHDHAFQPKPAAAEAKPLVMKTLMRIVGGLTDFEALNNADRILREWEIASLATVELYPVPEEVEPGQFAGCIDPARQSALGAKARRLGVRGDDFTRFLIKHARVDQLAHVRMAHFMGLMDFTLPKFAATLQPL
jgi:hypothetical protein